MPYIPKAERGKYTKILKDLALLVPQDKALRPGHLNYIVTMLLRNVYGDSMRYSDHNEAVRLLTCIQQEFYRRSTAPYEDKKIIEEGDLD